MADVLAQVPLTGAISLLAVTALVTWLLGDALYSRTRTSGDGDPAQLEQDRHARHLLWLDVGSLAIGAAVQTGALGDAIEDAWPGGSKVLMHFFGAMAAGFLLHLLGVLLNLCGKRRRRINAAMALTAVLVLAPFIVEPPQTSHLFEPSTAAVVHWVGSLALLAWALGMTVTACLALAGPGWSAAAVGMRLVALGCGIGLIYVLACSVILGMTLATGSPPPEVHGSGLDVTLQQLAELVIVMGLVATSVARLLRRRAAGVRKFPLRETVQAQPPGTGNSPRAILENLAPWRQLRRHREFLAVRDELRDISPWWSTLAAALPSLVHFPEQTARAPRTLAEAEFQRRRVMSEIHDIQRLAVAYVDEADLLEVRGLATRAGFPEDRRTDTAVWQVCVLLGIDRHHHRTDRRSHPLTVPPPHGSTLAEATTALSRSLDGVHPLREKLLQNLRHGVAPGPRGR